MLNKHLKMEITVKKTLEEKVVIELAAYRKDSVHVYKVYSSLKCIKVCHLKGYESISHTYAALPFEYETTESTESEFLNMYNKVNSELCQLVTA